MRKSLRLFGVFLMLSTLLLGAVSVAGADAPIPTATASIFLPVVADGALIHAQNVGTLQVRFQITYEGGDTTESGWINPGSAWTFVSPKDSGSARVEVIADQTLDGDDVTPCGAVLCDDEFAVSVDRAGVGAGTAAGGGNASYTGIGPGNLAFQDDSGAFWVYAPVVFKNFNGWGSVIYIQNTENVPTQLDIWFFDVNGNNPSFISNLQLAAVDEAGSSIAIDPSAPPASLPDGTYSAWIRATGPNSDFFASGVAVVVDEFKNGVAASYRGTADIGSASNPDADEPDQATSVYAEFAPLVFKAYNDWNAGIRVLNVNNQDWGQIKVSFRDTAGTVVFTFEDKIAPRSFKDFFFQDFANLPQNFVGSATVETLNFSPPGDENERVRVIAVANMTKWTAAANDDVPFAQSMAYNTINQGDAAQVIAAPFMAKHVGGWSTGFEVMNMDIETGYSLVTENLYTAAGLIWQTDAQLGPFATNGRQLDLRYVDAIPGGFLGSAIAFVSAVQGSQSGWIGGVVNEVASPDIDVTDGGKTYEAYPIFGPVIIFNPDGSRANVVSPG